MFSRHIQGKLAGYLDGKLSQSEMRRVEQHLAECEMCRIDRDQVRSGMSLMSELPLVPAPDGIWDAIEAAHQKTSSQYPQKLMTLWDRLKPVPTRPDSATRVAALYCAIVAVAAVIYWATVHQHQSSWEVVGLRGSTAIDSRPVRGVSRVTAGSWIETGTSSSAKVQIGAIGVVEMGPGTRLRVAAVRPSEHRLTLSRGEIHAKISAPPKLFFVDTASATAEDLGCEYSLKTDEHGSGVLQVTLGWVSFQWNGNESLVPAGASCRTRPHAGPGVPYFDDAPEALVTAIGDLAEANYAGASLDVILRNARVRDTLTLWHLLSRTGPSDRERIYDRIAALTPVPTNVSRDKALQLDPNTLTRWREALAWTW